MTADLEYEAESTRHRQSHRYMGLDGLRGVAALVVAVWHRRAWMPSYGDWHGYLAVDFFFLLSGFVISHAYGVRIARGVLSLRRFAIERVIRLYPLIFLGTLFGTTDLVINGLTTGHLRWMVNAIAAVPFAALAIPAPVFSEPFRTNPPVWSLFFELIANAAFAIVLARAKVQQLAAFTFLAAILIATIVAKHGDILLGWLWPTLPAGLARVSFSFVGGVLLQRLYAKGGFAIPGLPVWVTAVALTAILASPALPNAAAEVCFTVFVLFVAFPLIVASAVSDQPSPRWLAAAEISARLSYPLYILHTPIYRLLEQLDAFESAPALARYFIAVPTALCAALLAELLYDIPVRRALRNRLDSAKRFGRI